MPWKTSLKNHLSGAGSSDNKCLTDFSLSRLSQGGYGPDQRQTEVHRALPRLLTLSVFFYAWLMHDRDRHFSLSRQVRPSGRLWNPAADVYRTRDGWIIKLDLAGVRAEDLEVEVSSFNLRVRGCRRDTFVQEGFSYHQMEITYSRFEKNIKFPCSIQGASLARDYRDGWLIIRLRCEEKTG
jgi:HSP20 family protein